MGTRVADNQLLNLANELEAAATPYLAYDRDAEVTSADPDCEEARETGRRLYKAVKAVADQIFAHQPESLAGLLVQAHAATLVAEADWQDTSSFVGQDGTLLRIVANSLFRLAGVDWRGRPIDGRPPDQLDCTPPATADDAALLDLGRQFDAHHAAWLELAPNARRVEKEVEATLEGLRRTGRSPGMDDLGTAWDANGRRQAHRREADAFDAMVRVVEKIRDCPARTVEGLAVKARALSTAVWPTGTYVQEAGPGEEYPNDHIRDLIEATCALAGVDMVGRPLPHRPVSAATGASSSLDAALIPLAEAAIAEERAATAISEATDHDAPPGTFARSMQLLELVTATDARTPAGVAAKARLLLTHAPEEDDLDGNWRCQALALSLARDAAQLSCQ
ncbi:hypothetical protein [Methylobacterium sp. J-070]|uniref:hypothetical protein n=1 Tax=Methylobacterium sp. J-070 TaxID=2836650 RepID=UPI001FBB83C6|nr:hypothetical protein [Methylobacterium sp. J-070]MCJ2051196.1 hypothetical protein [Methylobacterium sp. J-070]